MTVTLLSTRWPGAGVKHRLQQQHLKMPEALNLPVVQVLHAAPSCMMDLMAILLSPVENLVQPASLEVPLKGKKRLVR